MGAITGFMALEMRGQNSESLSATNINLITPQSVPFRTNSSLMINVVLQISHQYNFHN